MVRSDDTVAERMGMGEAAMASPAGALAAEAASCSEALDAVAASSDGAVSGGIPDAADSSASCESATAGVAYGVASLEAVPSAAMLSALSQAFSYPIDGLDATLGALKALGDDEQGPWRSMVGEALLAAAEFPDRTAEQLAYTRLFIGSLRMEAPPYASYYLEEEHTLNGRAAAEVRGVYRQFGIELGPDEKAPADHLRYLLAFLGLLAARWEETGDAAFAEAYADFRDDYVLSWIGRCADLVGRNAEEPYYPALMRLIVAVLEGGTGGA